MEKVILDFDNTMGLLKKDIDDAIALTFLLKSKDVEIVAVSTTFGNGTIEEVNNATKTLFDDLDLNIPLFFGNENAGEEIAKIVSDNKNEITIISLGSLHNIAEAIKYDNNFVSNIKEFIAMGGITKDLIINGKRMAELNFSCSHHDSYYVLNNIKDPIIITGNSCLSYGLNIPDVVTIFEQDKSIERYFKEKSKHWFDYHLTDYDINYVIFWDLIAVIYFCYKEMFEVEYCNIDISEENLVEGHLPYVNSGKTIIFPNLKSKDEYKNKIKEIWKNELRYTRKRN